MTFYRSDSFDNGDGTHTTYTHQTTVGAELTSYAVTATYNSLGPTGFGALVLTGASGVFVLAAFVYGTYKPSPDCTFDYSGGSTCVLADASGYATAGIVLIVIGGGLDARAQLGMSMNPAARPETYGSRWQGVLEMMTCGGLGGFWHWVACPGPHPAARWPAGTEAIGEVTRTPTMGVKPETMARPRVAPAAGPGRHTWPRFSACGASPVRRSSGS